MKQFLQVVSVTIFVFVAGGLFYGSSDQFLLKNGLGIGLAIFMFIWVPVFLFYAYDRKQQRKETEDSEEE